VHEVNLQLMNSKKQQQKPKSNKQTSPAKQNVKRARKVVTTIKRPDQLVYRVPECAAMYAAALVDPFEAPCGACIPADLFPLPSAKTKTFVRGKFALGTGGVGFIYVKPTAANDGLCLKTTTSTSVGTSSAILSTFTNQASISMTQLPYTTAQLTAGVGTRIVAGGVRIKYIGQLMTRNGVCLTYEDPDHKDIPTVFSFDTLGANPYVKAHRIGSEEWDSYVCFSGPVTPSDVEFQQLEAPLGVASFLGLVVSGVAGDQYEFEYYQHTEYIGNIVVNKTPSHADAQAFGKVLEAAKGLTKDKPLEPSDAGGFWDRIKEGLSESMPTLLSAGKAIGTAIMGPNPLSILQAAGATAISIANLEDRWSYNHRMNQTVSSRDEPYSGPFAMLGM
jgi:hypothetical protein